ncbi:NFX1-type zinc finger-containing protein 1-like [Patiria miniata]|uniref:NF-X1-type domain-containing protein n=1 Tax=Patiria miniata TaxID=46514 RepID=A0A913ZMA2_PATMI|nr:NFX1-type zinc finger-containing protein 1-like [Patiria miniata]
MANGFDPSKELVYSHEKQSSDSSARNTNPQGTSEQWRRPPEDDDVFDTFGFGDDANLRHSSNPWGTGGARGGQRGQNFRNTDERSLMTEEAPRRGFDSSNWRNPGDSREIGRSWSSSSSFRDRTSLSTRYSPGEGSNAATWRNTKSSEEDKRIEAVPSGGRLQESGAGISRDFFRKPGRAAAKNTKSEGDADTLLALEVVQDGPDAASWRKHREQKLQAEPSEEDEDFGGFTEDGETFYNDSNSVGYDRYVDESTSQQRQTHAPYLHRTQLRRKTTGPSFTVQELENLLDEKSQDALLKLESQKDKLEGILSASDLDENTLLLIIRVLSCMCHLDQVSKTAYTREVSIILSMIESSLFLSKHLSRYLVGLCSKQADDCDDEETKDVRNLAEDVDMILDILKLFLITKPSAFSEVGVVMVLLQKVVTTAALNNSEFDPEGSRMAKVEVVKECCNCMEESQKTARERVKEKPPPDDFRDIPIFPRSTELRQMGKPFLRKNIVRGRYDSVEHYLDVQFRLLREDFVAPMREGITEFLSTTHGRLQDIRIYYDVFVEAAKTASNGIVHTLKFELRRRRPERWETSKRLLYGSFVCLSSDNFKHILCATVENRDLTDLEDGRVHVRFLTEVPLKCKGPFIMAESAAYFEAYRHVLKGLQQMNEKNFPFKKYIVDVASKVEPPAYLQDDEEVTYDLRPLVQGPVEQLDFQDPQTVKDIVNASYVPILDPGNWPSAKILHLDDSQLTSLQTALTKEFAIIQGPPGTGKTYIGLKIVELLLYNSPWNNNQPEEAKTSPILVVCYTNHALDQFLEGIIEFGEHNVVRIGSRSSSVKLKNKNLAMLRRHRPADIYREEKERLKIVEEELAKLDLAIQRILFMFHLPSKVILDVKALQDFMSMDNFRELSSKQPQSEKEAKLMNWLDVGDEPNEKVEKVSDKESEDTGDVEDPMEVEDEGAEIQRERQIDDSDDDFVTDRDQHRQALERAICSENAAHTMERTLDSKSVAEMQKSDVMTDQRADRLKRIWKLDLSDRWRLYRLWVKRYKDRHGARLVEHRERFEAFSKERETLKAQGDLEVLREANVIGMTTTGAARCRNVLQRLGPRIVVVEEAAEVLEAHIITTLTEKCQHLILIGDHQQLKPNPTVYRLAKLFNLDTSLFERMINNGVPCKTLSHQHRMRPEISQLMKRHFYKRLHDDTCVLDMENVMGMQHNMFFINHQRLEDGLDDNRTRSNQHEAEVLVGLCKYLLDQGYDRSQITILTTYKGQLFCIRRLMDRATFDGVRVSVVDNFQGEENDIILLSLVRSNEEGSIGFLRTQNRVCVALSRAKMGFYCIGNFTILKKAHIWKDIITTLEAQKKIDRWLSLVCQNHPSKVTRVATSKDFEEKASCGGCDRLCGQTLTCGHVCRLFCHPYDRQHKDYECHEPCQRFCQRGEHKCPLECHESCGACYKKVQKLFQMCGHETQVLCHQFDTVSCPEPCKKVFASCGHPCQRKCSERCETCPEKCEESLVCCHPCTEPCGRPCNTYCEVRVKRILETCGHEVTMDCSQTEIPCPKPCPKLFSSCQHQCRRTCGESCLEACPEKCGRKLMCGHPCKELCKETCTSYCKVKVTRILSKCQHKVLMECGESPEAFQCTRLVTKTHPSCGHDVLVDCCEDPGKVKCKKSVVKQRKSCGHQKAMPCYIDPNSRDCTDRCNKVLRCGHQCPNACGKPCEASDISPILAISYLDAFEEIDDLKVCEVIVEKSYPSCSHVIKLPCHKDVCEVPCTEICKKILSCGHLCPKKCSEPCPKEKLSRRMIYFYVKHEFDFSGYCRDKCKKVLSCGHVCPNKCSEPCPGDVHLLYGSFMVGVSTKCEKLVKKKLPGCGHTAEVECHKDVSALSCSEICGKTLSCGHVCKNKCGIACKCLRSVLKTLPNCDHTVRLSCYLDLSSYECQEKCERKLACEHGCPNKCGEPCPTEGALLSDEDEPSSLLRFAATAARTPARRCTEIVRKEFLDCDHSVDLPCFKDIKTVYCSERCEQILPCGHQCPNTCSDCFEDDTSSNEDEPTVHRPRHTVCEANVRKILTCGHEQDMACRSAGDSDHACSEPCTGVLACGHRCRGNCDDCEEGEKHVPCEESCERQLLCGHTCLHECDTVCPPDCISCRRNSRSNQSRSSRHESQDLETYRCTHRGMRNRQLKSKACILRCTQLCKRGKHTCIGVCGEPCPPLCNVCDEFKWKADMPKNIRQKDTFIYLPDCGHLCETRTLDRMVANIQSHLRTGFFEIRSLLCPKCKEPILSCPRYQDTLGIIKKSVDAAKKKCNQRRTMFSGLYMTSTSSGKGASSSVSFAVGRWLRCPRGHVFCLENDKQAEQQEPACPKCSKE